MKFRFWMTQDDTKEEIKFSSSLRPSTRSDSVIPLNIKHDLRSETRLRKSVSGSGNFPPLRYLDAEISPELPDDHIGERFRFGGIIVAPPARREPTTVRTYYPQGNSVWLFPYMLLAAPSVDIRIRVRQIYAVIQPSLPLYLLLPSPFLILFLFLFAFCYPFLSPPFSCCFLLFYSLILFQSVTVPFFFALAISNSIHPHTIHLSIQSIHTYMRALLAYIIHTCSLSLSIVN